MKKAKQKPLLSIIIPTIGNRDTLHATLASLSKNKTTLPYEIILVNNSKYSLKQDFTQCRVLQEKKLGLHYARNAGYRVAKSNLLAFLDDDVIVNTHWIQTAIDVFANHSNLGLVGGSVRPHYTVQPPDWLAYTFNQEQEGQTNYFLSLIDLGRKEKICAARNIIGCNLLITKKLYTKIGGSHPDLMPKQDLLKRGDGETYMADKTELLGYHAYYHPSLAVKHMVTKERMTKKYIYARAYYQAYEDSFAFWRAQSARGISRIKVAIQRFFQVANTHHINTLSLFIEHKTENLLFSNQINLSYIWGTMIYTMHYLTSAKLRRWVQTPNYLKD